MRDVNFQMYVNAQEWALNHGNLQDGYKHVENLVKIILELSCIVDPSYGFIYPPNIPDWNGAHNTPMLTADITPPTEDIECVPASSHGFEHLPTVWFDEQQSADLMDEPVFSDAFEVPENYFTSQDLQDIKNVA